MTDILDVLILVFVCYLAYRGFRRGALGEVVSVASVFAGFFVGIHFLRDAAALLPATVNPEWLRDVIAFLVLFIFVVIGLHLLGRLITRVLNLTFLGTADSGLGMVIGAAKGLVIVFFLTVTLLAIFPSSKDRLAQSVVIPRVILISDVLANTVPEIVRAQLWDYQGAAFVSLLAGRDSDRCSHCGEQLSSSDSYCSTCGSRTGMRQICPQCLLPLSDSIQLCPVCRVKPVSTSDDQFDTVISQLRGLIDLTADRSQEDGVLVRFDRQTLHGVIVDQGYDTVQVIPASFANLERGRGLAIGDSVIYSTGSLPGRPVIALRVERQ